MAQHVDQTVLGRQYTRGILAHSDALDSPNDFLKGQIKVRQIKRLRMQYQFEPAAMTKTPVACRTRPRHFTDELGRVEHTARTRHRFRADPQVDRMIVSPGRLRVHGCRNCAALQQHAGYSVPVEGAQNAAQDLQIDSTSQRLAYQRDAGIGMETPARIDSILGQPGFDEWQQSFEARAIAFEKTLRIPYDRNEIAPRCRRDRRLSQTSCQQQIFRVRRQRVPQCELVA
jgi:hypothetical protein